MLRSSLRLCKKKETDVVPLDLLIEILNGLPAKSVGRLMIVSKSWAKIIRSKIFTRCFPFRSLTQPTLRLLIALSGTDGKTGRRNCFFFSTSSLSSSTISTSFLSEITLPCPYSYPSYYVNGLMNIGQIICNPCTGKFITLPRLVKTTTGSDCGPGLVKRFFGYDPVDHQYKVLCVSPSLAGQGTAPRYDDFQVFTLGAKPKSWKLIDCSVPHSPRSGGVCIDGFVYYIAQTGTQTSLMRFGLKSEKFDIFASVSEDLGEWCRRYSLTLINYHGKVAAAIQTLVNVPSIDLFVFEAGKQDFKERSFYNTPSLVLRMKGINHASTSEIHYSYHGSAEASVLRHDLNGASFNEMKIEVDTNHLYCSESNITWVT